MNHGPSTNNVVFQTKGHIRRRVAIITRTKNRTILLRRAFESVLSQHHQDWHIYVVNDGGIASEVDALAASYEGRLGGRLSIFHNETSVGLARAINTALVRVDGEYLAIHDDDDSWHPDFLTQTISFLEESKNDQFVAVMAKFYYISEQIKDGTIVELGRRLVNNWPITLKFFPLLYWNAFPPICYIIRMQAVEKLGLVNENLVLLEDTDYLRRLLALGDVATLQEPLAYYHHRPKVESNQLQNSTLTLTNDYNIYDRRIGNGLIRRFLNDNPANIGLIYALGSLHAQIDELRANVAVDPKVIAREIYYEANRHSIGYKLSKLFRKLFRLQSIE